jgi:hypothetical protein
MKGAQASRLCLTGARISLTTESPKTQEGPACQGRKNDRTSQAPASQKPKKERGTGVPPVKSTGPRNLTISLTTINHLKLNS